jgi:adenylosuccinate synthase
MPEKKMFTVCGMFYGDEGKGSTTDFICREYKAGLIVRYNGGPQNAHNVVTPDGIHHTFSQFGSGSFLPNVKTHLSHQMLIDPIAMVVEDIILKQKGVDVIGRTTIDAGCVIITPFAKIVNQIAESARGHKAHGSCGVGLGMARELSLSSERAHCVLRAGDVLRDRAHISDILWNQWCYFEASSVDFSQIAMVNNINNTEIKDLMAYFSYGGKQKIRDLCDYYIGWSGDYDIVPKDEYLYDLLNHIEDPIIFEGSQGVLLDEKHGIAPHNTWTDTTLNNVFDILKGAGYITETGKHYNLDLVNIGCIRPYLTRHGAGPLSGESISTVHHYIKEDHNFTSRFAGQFRYADLDLGILKDSFNIVNVPDTYQKIDCLSISCLDHLFRLSKVFVRDHGDLYSLWSSEDNNQAYIDVPWIVNIIEEYLDNKTPVKFIGFGPSAKSRLIINPKKGLR